MKLSLSLLLILSSVFAYAVESDTPCPAMNQETREKIISIKEKSISKVKSVIRQ